MGVPSHARTTDFRSPNRIDECSIRLDQARKGGYPSYTWRYGAGGWAKLFANQIFENRTSMHSDTRSRVSAPPDETPVPDWLVAELGLAKDPSGEFYDAQMPLAPILSKLFQDDFTDVDENWSRSGGLTRLEKHEGTLLAWLRRYPAELTRALDWNLDSRNLRYVVVFELSGEGFSDARLALYSDVQTVTRPIEAHADLSEFRFVAVELPPGRYRELRIEAMPGVDGGRIALRGFELYALPL